MAPRKAWSARAEDARRRTSSTTSATSSCLSRRVISLSEWTISLTRRTARVEASRLSRPAWTARRSTTL
ncbi:hypothetical protein [Ornithinimicrobium kibberense]|uniref:hypothetical protein n=1 Tax=Ornithinimicrobium kibberense TaxID=282060 RepID=UPI00361AB740